LDTTIVAELEVVEAQPVTTTSVVPTVRPLRSWRFTTLVQPILLRQVQRKPTASVRVVRNREATTVTEMPVRSVATQALQTVVRHSRTTVQVDVAERVTASVPAVERPMSTEQRVARHRPSTPVTNSV